MNVINKQKTDKISPKSERIKKERSLDEYELKEKALEFIEKQKK